MGIKVTTPEQVHQAMEVMAATTIITEVVAMITEKADTHMEKGQS